MLQFQIDHVFGREAFNTKLVFPFALVAFCYSLEGVHVIAI